MTPDSKNGAALRWNSVDEREEVARFLVDEGHEFSRSGGKVKSGAFRVGRSNRLSVYRTSRESLAGPVPADEIWSLARTHVEPGRGPVLARADVGAVEIFALGLKIDPDGIPHPRHANITGWPEKEKQLDIRQALAKAARLVLRE